LILETRKVSDKFDQSYVVEVYCGPDSLLLHVLDKHGRAAEISCTFEHNEMRIDDFTVSNSREGQPPRYNRGIGTPLVVEMPWLELRLPHF
jgi:hypothetical protein